jgi:hypothetical protein
MAKSDDAPQPLLLRRNRNGVVFVGLLTLGAALAVGVWTLPVYVLVLVFLFFL